eukprot:9485664-Pyramimonas_sp.AAC.2
MGYRTEEKAELVSELLAAKEASGKTFTQIANELGLTNCYVANLFMNQVHYEKKVRVERTPSLAYPANTRLQNVHIHHTSANRSHITTNGSRISPM